MIENKSLFVKGQEWEEGINCKRTHEFWGLKKCSYVMIIVVDKMTVNIFSKLSEPLYWKPEKCVMWKLHLKILEKFIYNKSAYSSNNYFSRNISLSKQIFVKNPYIIYIFHNHKQCLVSDLFVRNIFPFFLEKQAN